MNWPRQLAGMQRVAVLLRLTHEGCLEKEIHFTHTQTCEHPHTHCISPSRIKEKCHVDFPIWKRQPGREKRSQAKSQDTWARVPACCSCGGWPLSSGPHRPVHTTGWPGVPATLFSPLWMVPKPEWHSPVAQRSAAAPVGVSTFQE